MESVELSARSVDEAIQQALIRLGKNRDEVEVTVLNEGHKGILGFVRGESARVRVTVRQAAAGQADGPGRAPAPRPRPTRAAPRVEPAPRVEAAPPRDTEPTPRRQAGQAPRPKLSETALVAKDTLEELLEKMGIDADVAYRGGSGEEDSPMLLDVEGEDLGILIGRRGETLASLQFLLNLMVGKRLQSWIRVQVDVEGYRARREESLRSLATRVADRVHRTGQTIALEPMPANERRLVHLALQDNPHVYTESSGYGEDRRVNVIPRSREGVRG